MAYSITKNIGGFDNNGTFVRVCNWKSDKDAGIKILAARMDDECDNFAAGFNKCITRDMKGKPTQDFDFNGYAGKNLYPNVKDPTSAVNVAIAFQDVQRLFYDTSTVANIINLKNAYMDTAAISSVEGCHFYFVTNTTNTSSTIIMRFDNTAYMADYIVVGGNGNLIPVGALISQAIHSAVIYIKDGVYRVAVISIGSGGSGGGGQVDSIVPADKTIAIDNSDPVRPRISVEIDEVIDATVRTINGEPPDAEGNIVIGEEGEIVSTINGYKPDNEGDIDGVMMEQPKYDDISIPYTEIQKTFNDAEKVLRNPTNINALQNPQSFEDLPLIMSTIGGCGGYNITFNNTRNNMFKNVIYGGMTHGKHSVKGITLVSFALDDTCCGGQMEFSGYWQQPLDMSAGAVIQNCGKGTVLTISDLDVHLWKAFNGQNLFYVDGGTVIVKSTVALPTLGVIPGTAMAVVLRNGASLIVEAGWSGFSDQEFDTDQTCIMSVGGTQYLPYRY